MSIYDNLGAADIEAMAWAEARMLKAAADIQKALTAVLAAETYADEALSAAVTDKVFAAWLDPLKAEILDLISKKLVLVMTSGEVEL